jgi:hypothetical protein
LVAKVNGPPELTDQGVFERMVGMDEVVVSRVEPIDVSVVGNGIELSSRASIAIDTGENEVPYLIEVLQYSVPLKSMRKDMIDVSEIC